MDASHNETSIESFLAHGDWVRLLARRLISEGSLAEDVVQDTWLAALESPPTHAGNLRGWLARVVQNRARQVGKSEKKRRVREQDSARPELQLPLDEIAQRAASQREVVGYVLDLDEPFRSVVLLRFFEECPPREIARRLAIPLMTVNSRLQRAFAKLRVRLDSEYGGREAWCIALTPLSLQSLGGSTSQFFIMNTNMKLALGLTALGLGGWGIWQTTIAPHASAEEPVQHETNELEVAAAPHPVEGALTSIPEPISEREQLLQSEPEPQTLAPSPEIFRVQGHVWDVNGEPVPNVKIVSESFFSLEPMWSTEDGSFELEVSMNLARQSSKVSGFPCLRIEDPDWITLLKCCSDPTSKFTDNQIVVAAVRALEGWVHSTDGLPIDMATIQLSSKSKTSIERSIVLETTQWVTVESRSNRAGRFFFERFPDASGLKLEVSSPGFRSKLVALDEIDWPPMIELERPGEGDVVAIEGIVLDAEGFPLEGAEVRLATNGVRSGPGGAFRLLLEEPRLGEATPLCASLKGHQAALVPNFAKYLKDAGGNPEPIELVLGKSLEIRGQVIDGQGKACAGWKVCLLEPTEVSQFRTPVVSAEGLSGMTVGGVTTDKQGSFALKGLYPREYTLHAYEPKSLQRVEAVVQAGEHAAVLRVQRVAPVTLKGRVTDLEGVPLPDVRLIIQLAVQMSKTGSKLAGGESAQSDEQGFFELTYVPGPRISFYCMSPLVLPSLEPFPPVEEAEDYELKLPRRCHIRVEALDRYSKATNAIFLDEHGEQVPVTRERAGGTMSFPFASLVEGQSEVLAVSQAATTLIFRSGTEELGRVPIRLSGDAVNVLRP